MPSYIVDVTQEDIDNARRANSQHCPVARAVAYTDADFRYIKVTRDQIAFTDVETRMRYVYAAPAVVRNFIDNWDNDREVVPFKFDLYRSELITKRGMKSRKPASVGRGPTARPTPKNEIGSTQRRPVYARGERTSNGKTFTPPEDE